MNDFEKYVDDYDNGIGNNSLKYFSLKDKPEILSRAFYKLWELLFMYDLIDLKKDKFVSAHLAEGPGSFVQATMFYRDMYCKKGLSKNDKYYAVTLHPEDTTTHVPNIESKFTEFYEKEKPKRFILHKTYTKEMSGGSKIKDNGNIIDPKTIKLFGGQMDEYADFITADGGFNWINESVQEQEASKLIFAQIVCAFKLQEKGGSFVCKFFETFTMTSVKMLAILLGLYKEVYITKPLMSRPTNSEKYVICLDFKFNHKDDKYKDIDKKFSNMLKEIHTNKDNIVDIFSDYDVPEQFLNLITEINTEVSNTQLWSLNNTFSFINSNNYYGDLYQSRREEQINASTFWTDLFYPEVNKIDEHRKKSKELLNYANEVSKEETKNLTSVLRPTFDQDVNKN
jgi:23S rRNA U2552 (ribose-2'-O)-methylase RlmE/FtsJ